jgi:LCP family protein required for cell wall assembly
MKNKKIIIIFAVVAAITLVVAGVFAFCHYQNKITVNEETTAKSETEATSDSPETINPEDVEWNGDEFKEETNTELVNILLIGQDRREGEDRQRSDAMILCSLNPATSEIAVISFLRDLYVQIPGYLDNRLNVAYRYGDVTLMNETFLVNFGLEIDGNVMVDFDEFTEIIEVIGGVTLEISQAEADYMNRKSDNSFQAGVNYMNAKDALTFTRMRYAAGGDYGRTDRQRRVLMALAESVRHEDVWTLLELFNQILPHISTNLDNAQILQCIKDGAAILSNGGQIQTYRIPQDDAHYPASIRGMAVLVPDLEECREDLQEFIFSDAE